MPRPYGFPEDQAGEILAGRKGLTIRALGKMRHAQAGDDIGLYAGLRTARCRLVARVRVIAVDPISIQLDRPAVHVGGEPIDDLGAFARFDGFPDFAALARYRLVLRETALRSGKPTCPPERFEGIVIRWLPWPADLFAGSVIPETLDRPQVPTEPRTNPVIPGLFERSP